jgi:hypothetical protein
MHARRRWLTSPRGAFSEGGRFLGTRNVKGYSCVPTGIVVQPGGMCLVDL